MNNIYPVAWNKIESGSKFFITAENEEEYYFAAKAFAVGKAPAIVFEASFAPETDMWVFTKNEDDTWKISTTDGADLYNQYEQWFGMCCQPRFRLHCCTRNVC